VSDLNLFFLVKIMDNKNKYRIIGKHFFSIYLIDIFLFYPFMYILNGFLGKSLFYSFRDAMGHMVN